MDEFVYRGPYGYIEEANYQSIATGGASGGNSETDKEQNQEIAKLNEAVSATSEAVAANTENIETLQSDVDEIKGAGYQTEDQVKDAISEVVDGAPEALDTLKEIADKLSDNDDAVAGLVNSVASAQTAAEAADAKADAVKEELEAKIDEKADASALNETNNAVAALSDRVDAIDVPTLSGYATEEWVEEQGFASADDLTAEITRAMNKEGELAELIAEKATNDDLTAEKERAEAAEQAIDAKFEGLAEASAVTAEIAAAVEPINEKDAAQDEELAKKVEWVESTPGRNHIVLKNHDNILGTATDGTIYNLAMVSKWDVADFGTTSLHLNFNTSDAVTINDNKVVATEDVVDEKIAAIDGFAKPEDLEPKADASAVTEEIAAAIAPLAVKAEVSEEINAVSDALAQFETQVADEYQLKGDYLTEDALEGLAKESAVTEEIAAAVATVEATVATKADATAVETLESTVATKADADKVYTKEEVDTMLAEKQAEIDAMKTEYAKLKDIVGDLGGAVEYSVPEDGTFNNMMKKSGIITLKEDVTTGTYTGGITSKNITTLKLGGKTLTFSGTTTNNPAIMTRGTQQLTVTGSGTLDAAGRIAIEANGADTVINLGGTMFGRPTYVTDRSGGELIYCYLGTINITEGIFKNNGADKSFMLNCYDANYQNGTAKIIVTGGKFYDFDPANNSAEGPGTSYVPEGYESVASTEVIDDVEHTVYTVKKVS